MTWNLSEARNRLSEVLDRAEREGPQKIQRRNEAFVIIPEAQYAVLVGERPTSKDWLLKGPRFDDLTLPARRASPMRELKL